MGAGLHILWFKAHLIWISRSPIGEMSVQGWDNQPYQQERITLTTWGRSNSLLKSVLEEAREMSLEEDRDKQRVYVLSQYGYSWRRALSRERRPLGSVILDGDNADLIIKDAKRFFTSEDWYRDRGIPYRRGVLLYGSPGTGKTSFASAIAGELRLHICVLTLSSKSLDDGGLNQRLHDAPVNAILLLEDVDAVFVQRESKDMRSGVTFSGLLNAIDGVASQEGRILFMTTNHPEKLDPALVRPGRCDLKVHFDLASRNQVRRLFLRFFPDERDLADQFAERIPSKKISMAQLQGHLMKYSDDVVRCHAEAPAFVDRVLRGHHQGDSVVGWLVRLGLEQYVGNFMRARITDMDTLKELGEGNFTQMGIDVSGHRMRMVAMLAGRDDVKHGFAALNEDQLRLLFTESFGLEPDADCKEADELVALVPDRTVSLFQARKYFASCSAGGPAGALANVRYLNDPMLRLPAHSADLGCDSGLQTELEAETSVARFLHRCGFESVLHLFEDEKLTMDDVRALSAGDYEKLGIKREGDKNWLTRILKSSDAEAVSAFCFATPEDAREIVLDFFPHTNAKKLSQFCKRVTPDTVSRLQLRAHIQTNRGGGLAQCQARLPEFLGAAGALALATSAKANAAVAVADEKEAEDGLAIRPWLLRLGLSDQTKKLEDQNIFVTSQLPRVYMDLMNNCALRNHGVCTRLVGMLKGDPAVTRLYRFISVDEACEMFKTVFPGSKYEELGIRFKHALERAQLGQPIELQAVMVDDDPEKKNGDDEAEKNGDDAPLCTPPKGTRFSCGQVQHFLHVHQDKPEEVMEKFNELLGLEPDKKDAAKKAKLEDDDLKEGASVAALLDKLSLSKHAGIFAEQNVATIGVLKKLTDAELKDLKLPLGVRKKILALFAA